MAKLDLVERSDLESLSRRLIRYRLKLAGYADADFTRRLDPEVIVQALSRLQN